MALRTTAFIALLAAGTLAQHAFAQYPNKPVRFIVPFAPGGAADIISRGLAEPLGRNLGQPIIIENKPGAASSLAIEFVAKSAPDGYTTVISSQSGMIINPITNKNVGYDPEKDLIAVTQVTRSPLVVAVNPKLSAKNMRELIAEAKATSSKLNYATSGIGSMPHFATVVFSVFAGVDMVHVPYKSGGLAVTSVVAGDTHLTFATSPSVMPQVNAGRLRGLAVTTRQKSPLVPTLPGMADSGLSNYDVSIWYGLFLPAGTPRPVVMRLFEATTKSLPDPKFQEMMAKDGTETPASKSPEEFAAFIRDETRITAKVIKESGAKFE